MLAEIAVKNFLLQLSKRVQEKALYKNMQEKTGFLTNPEDLFGIKELDVRDYTEELFFHKDIADTEKQGGYQILFWKVLPYTIPIAMQSAVALAKDMEGKYWMHRQGLGALLGPNYLRSSYVDIVYIL